MEPHADVGATSAYVIGLFVITDIPEIRKYAEQVEATVTKHGGRIVVKGGPIVEVLEGAARPQRATIVEFPTVERALAWYRSPEYQSIVGHRHKGGATDLLLVEGSAPAATEPVGPGRSRS
jgi:uncharacterized protein (DUF1330 family)